MDDAATRDAVGTIAALLRETAWGRASWQDVCAALADAVPGTVPAITNYDPSGSRTNAIFEHGMDPAAVASYAHYYVTINPWLDFWKDVPSGMVRVSERDSPSSALANTEFYNDWLKPQENMTAATGVGFAIDDANAVLVAWHYDAARAKQVGRTTAAILTGLSQPMEDAVRTAAAVGRTLEEGRRLGPFIEAIEGSALLLDGERRIREANASAEKALVDGSLMGLSGGALVLRDAQAQLWLERSVELLLNRAAAPQPVRVVRSGERIYSLSLSRAPDYTESGMTLLVRPRPLLLLVARLLFGGRVEIDAEALRLAFGLSRAELRLCQFLLDGHSLAAAAARLSLSEGTIRQRVKDIFQKTATHRQGELVALLARFGRLRD